MLIRPPTADNNDDESTYNLGSDRGGRREGREHRELKGVNKVVVKPHRHGDVFIAKGKEDALCTKKLSEDDGEGGRRKKKGVKEKIKETLTGGTHDDNNKKELADQQHPAQTTAVVENEGEEKKGMMEKIKEKIPDMH
ncbi:hypothetical protein HAX54_051388 [Datura stramonium]|uniref:Dehydrin n=1 Tax=Datura stramonium TaxID=4076 RepID=A0ABS8SY64_DATST|nr:hypothetical protein [Datura stramonium]